MEVVRLEVLLRWSVLNVVFVAELLGTLHFEHRFARWRVIDGEQALRFGSLRQEIARELTTEERTVDNVMNDCNASRAARTGSGYGTRTLTANSGAKRRNEVKFQVFNTHTNCSRTARDLQRRM